MFSYSAAIKKAPSSKPQFRKPKVNIVEGMITKYCYMAGYFVETNCREGPTLTEVVEKYVKFCMNREMILLASKSEHKVKEMVGASKEIEKEPILYIAVRFTYNRTKNELKYSFIMKVILKENYDDVLEYDISDAQSLLGSNAYYGWKAFDVKFISLLNESSPIVLSIF